jgi:hypothetical protein
MAKEMVNKSKDAAQYFPDIGVKNTQVLTDISSEFWTVVIQSEVEDLNTYMDMATTISKNPQMGEAMKGYMDLVQEGYREIFKIE